MKVIFITLFSFASVVAQADVVCTDVKAGPDHGYYLQFPKELDSVKVSMQSIAGPRDLTRLNCEFMADTMPTELGKLRPVVGCYEPQLRDAGYAATLFRANGSSKLSASLSEITIAGSRVIAKFTCKTVK